MSRQRASIFDEDDLDVSNFAPKAGPDSSAPPLEQVRAVAEAARFRSREPTPPPATNARRVPRRHRTGRNVQFNVKASQETIDAFYAISDSKGWVLGETLEHALAALQRELAGKDGAGTSRPSGIP
jgi:hypothetical protein